MTVRNEQGAENEVSGRSPEEVAPWLVLLSQHMPIPVLDDAGWPDGVTCSCGSPLYVGHMPGLIVDRVERMLGDLQGQLDAAKVANTAVWVAAERASRKGYELDPDEVLDMLKEDR